MICHCLWCERRCTARSGRRLAVKLISSVCAPLVELVQFPVITGKIVKTRLRCRWRFRCNSASIGSRTLRTLPARRLGFHSRSRHNAIVWEWHAFRLGRTDSIVFSDNGEYVFACSALGCRVSIRVGWARWPLLSPGRGGHNLTE